ncbi:MAG: hypothetical protein ABR970_08190 [Roseiarcus sp.]
MTDNWSEWRKFPDPRKRESLVAPFGPGCYELRHGNSKVLFGRGNHVAKRMTSLLLPPHGSGTRNNRGKREYVFENIGSIEYRTIAFSLRGEAKECEDKLKESRAEYKFKT